jgi:hypothetical protein
MPVFPDTVAMLDFTILGFLIGGGFILGCLLGISLYGCWKRRQQKPLPPSTPLLIRRQSSVRMIIPSK